MKLTEINKIRCHAKKIKYGRSAMTPIRQFIITNFANIVIGLSLAFLIFSVRKSKYSFGNDIELNFV